MMFRKNTKAMVRSLDDDTIFDIVTGIFPGDTWAPYVYNLPRLPTTNVNRSKKRKWFHIRKDKKQTISHWNQDNTNYADDLALHTNTRAQTKFLLHCIVETTGGIGLYMNSNKSDFMCFKQEKKTSL